MQAKLSRKLSTVIACRLQYFLSSSGSIFEPLLKVLVEIVAKSPLSVKYSFDALCTLLNVPASRCTPGAHDFLEELQDVEQYLMLFLKMTFALYRSYRNSNALRSHLDDSLSMQTKFCYKLGESRSMQYYMRICYPSFRPGIDLHISS